MRCWICHGESNSRPLSFYLTYVLFRELVVCNHIFLLNQALTHLRQTSFTVSVSFVWYLLGLPSYHNTSKYFIKFVVQWWIFVPSESWTGLTFVFIVFSTSGSGAVGIAADLCLHLLNIYSILNPHSQPRKPRSHGSSRRQLHILVNILLIVHCRPSPAVFNLVRETTSRLGANADWFDKGSGIGQFALLSAFIAPN